jgi:molecular chaperone GrpE
MNPLYPQDPETETEAEADVSGAIPDDDLQEDPVAAEADAESAIPEEAAPDEAAGEDGGEPDDAPSPEDVLKDRLLRLQADFDNYRKRIDRERKDWAVFANEKLLKDLLPALDSFDLGLANGEKAGAPAALLEGLRLVQGQFESALAKSDITPIDAGGLPFDPNLHEAITHMPSATVPEGTVIAQTRRGWKMGDKLLRAAQVVVSSGEPA